MGNIAKIVYIVLLIIALIFLIISLFSSYWKKYDNSNEMSFGLFNYECYGNDWTDADRAGFDDDSGEIHNYKTDRSCRRWWNGRREYEIWTAVLMSLAVIAAIAALLTALILFKFMSKLYFISPLFAAISALLVLSAFIIYAHESDDHVPVISSNNTRLHLNVRYHFGYAFWLSLVSFIILTLATILGFMASKGRKTEKYQTHSEYNPSHHHYQHQHVATTGYYPYDVRTTGYYPSEARATGYSSSPISVSKRDSRQVY